jgi:hypothetical protein
MPLGDSLGWVGEVGPPREAFHYGTPALMMDV